jgi:shikimate kinase
MRVYLTGFMGAGKSTIGRLVASRMGWEFISLDHEIERAAGRSIATIFEESGESLFRKMETECLHRTAADPAVVATGGGCFIHNTDWMLQNGTVVFLDVPFDVLSARIGADPSRPLWKNAQQLFHERESIYRKAHHVMDATMSPEETAAEIQALFSP